MSTIEPLWIAKVSSHRFNERKHLEQTY